MGLYDREYLQDEYHPRSGMAGARMMVTNLLILNGGIFFLNVFVGGDQLVDWLSVRPGDLLQPWMWWRLLTSGFVHDPTGIGHVFWNMFALFIFGRDVEWRYGRWEFLRFYLVAIVLGSVLWCVRYLLQGTDPMLPPGVEPRLLGASGGVTAVILLFVYNFPRRTILLMFVLPVPAWVLGVLIIFGNVTGVLGAETRTAFDVHLVGAAFATGYFWLGWNLAILSPDSWREGIRWPRLRWPARKRPKLRIHDPVDKELQQEEEADRILAKVSRDGIESLTPQERRVLEDYSRRVRNRRGS